METCISNIFSEKESTKLEDKIDLEIIHNEVIESIHDDYTGYNINESIDDGGRVDIEITNDCNTQSSKERSVSPLSSKYMFTNCRQKRLI